MPFIDTLASTIEKEKLPRQGKFRQGFYDLEVFERTDTGKEYRVAMQDSEAVRREYEAKGFRLNKGSDVNSYFIGFNMLDPTIGDVGTTPDRDSHRKIRQAVSIALDWEQYSKIFPNKAGQTAMGPLPPGIFGSREGTREGVNPITHTWVAEPNEPDGGHYERRSIADARKLIAEAGFPNGRNEKTGQPLVLNYDFYAAPTPENKAEIDWVVRQFAKIDIQLEVRATDNNQFQDKVRKGTYQVFWLGWNADYPDAENFLFLLTTLAGKTKYDGENTANYANPEYDKLFEQMKMLDDGPEKQKLIDELVTIARRDAPWTMGFFPFASAAAQQWVHNYKPAILIRDTARFLRVDVPLRVERQKEWNKPVWWPATLLLAAAAALVWIARRSLKRRERTNARGEVLV